MSVGLVGPEGVEPELQISQLEGFDDHDGLCEWLSKKTRCNRKPAALAKLLDQRPEGVDLARLRVACGHDDDIVERVMPYWGIIRQDLRGLPVVLLPGSMFVTQTSTRRNTGAQYTTKTLAEEVVQYALEPLVYDPGAQNESDQEKWVLKQPDAILDLRVCDPAVGSGAILTAAGRYLADRLVESVLEYGPGEGPFASRLHELAHTPAEEQTVLARREVVDHCLYGVDKNPVAAEMAKLSLWLTTMARERPFTFLDHAIQVGDSLLGITDIDQLRWLHLDPSQRHGQRGFESIVLDDRLTKATEFARRLREMSVVTVRDAAEKRRMHDELCNKLADLSAVADAVVGAELSTAGKRGLSMENRLETQLERIRAVIDDDRSEAERWAALSALHAMSTSWLRTDMPDEAPMPWDRRCLHWPLAFPEVFLADDRHGFDAVVANPPFLGGKQISGALGDAFRSHLVHALAGSTRGNADLVVFFLLRACAVGSLVGTLATNSVSQADSREVGLDRLVAGGWDVYRGVKSAPWPNEAAVEIAKLWLFAGAWTGSRNLDGSPVDRISPSLEIGRRVSGVPEKLVRSSGKSFQGAVLAHQGFVIDTAEARLLRAVDPRNIEVVKPYLTGSDVNESIDHSSSRWVVDFAGFGIDRAQEYVQPFHILSERVRDDVLAKSGYPNWDKRWWQFWNPRRAMRDATRGLQRILVVARLSKTIVPVFIPAGSVTSEQIVVLAYEDDRHLGLFSSALHWWWAHTWCSTMRSAGLRYSPTDAVETFPKPRPEHVELWDSIGDIAAELDSVRTDLMRDSNVGLTKIYNRVHDPDECDAEVERLRRLHCDLDHAVRDAYGWSDLKLQHQHWETSFGWRFTVSPEAKDELLDRLLELNHHRYAEEIAAGLHEKKSKKSTTRRTSSTTSKGQGKLL